MEIWKGFGDETVDDGINQLLTDAWDTDNSAATNAQSGEGVAIKKVTNVFSKKILAKRALREIKLLQHFRGECFLLLRLEEFWSLKMKRLTRCLIQVIET